MYFTYALRSFQKPYIYVGISDDLNRRLNQHNKGYTKSTKPYRPFFLFYYESFENRMQARSKEKYFKTASGKRFLKHKLREFLDKNKTVICVG
jgi:putative endonuclease